MLAQEKIRRGESFRVNLHSSQVAGVDNCFVGPAKPAPSGYEPGYQIVLPYHGLFSYFAGSRGWLLDATRTFCISPGWEFTEDKPVPGVGHAAILINPSVEVIDEICGSRAADRNPAFLHASLPCSRQQRLLTHLLLRLQGLEGDQDCLRTDEWIVMALSQLKAPRPSRARASVVIGKAKEVLHAHCGERLSLQKIASMVGVTPVYLTQEFRRSEGLPLYQYQMELRLNRALLELPDCESITELALDLGFSSHSHFTSVFRKAFGITPSQYRSGRPELAFESQLKAGNAEMPERRRAA
jgi:AraC family transcriptional regulator